MFKATLPSRGHSRLFLVKGWKRAGRGMYRACFLPVPWPLPFHNSISSWASCLKGHCPQVRVISEPPQRTFLNGTAPPGPWLRRSSATLPEALVTWPYNPLTHGEGCCQWSNHLEHQEERTCPRATSGSATFGLNHLLPRAVISVFAGKLYGTGEKTQGGSNFCLLSREGQGSASKEAQEPEALSQLGAKVWVPQF